MGGVSFTRPVSRSAWVRALLAALLATLVAAGSAPLALAGDLPPGGTFIDDNGNIHEGMIEAIAAAEITNGCDPVGPLYCPSDFVTRGQMASFLARAFDLPPPSDDYFSDDDGNIHEDNINRVAQAEITLGFPDGTFRPHGLVTRAQMASFIARAMGLAPIPGDRFDDVSGVHEGNINAIAEAEITIGCNPEGTLYCPDDFVRRDQMASFLGRALELEPMVPPPPGATTTTTTMAAVSYSISPGELTFSTVKGTPTGSKTVTVTNTGPVPATVSSASLSGTDAADFTITSSPPLPAVLGPGSSAPFDVAFSPDVGSVGSLSAALDFAVAGASPSSVGLFGLSTDGEEGVLEPPLQDVVNTVGHAIDVGWPGLTNPTGADPAPVGDEVDVSLWTKADSGPVTVTAVARYSPDEAIPFGWYQAFTVGPTINAVDTLSTPDEHQTLFPATVGSMMTFDPGAAVFGMYTTSTTHTILTEAARNTSGTHRVRAYPLEDRDGLPVADAYLLAFEEAANNDYQDYVFVLENVTPYDASSGLPFVLEWDADEGRLVDGGGVGTGFPLADLPSFGTGYVPGNLAVDGGTLSVTTTSGIMYEGENSQDNALAIDVDASGQTLTIETTIVGPASGVPGPLTGFEQAGIWLGNDEDNYTKLVVVQFNNGDTLIQLLREESGAEAHKVESVDLGDLTLSTVTLTLVADSGVPSITASYDIGDGGGVVALGATTPSGGFLGANARAGIFASHRLGGTEITYMFDSFSVTAS